jgi:hypothetical protein
MASFSASEWVVDEFGKRLHGADKATLARSVYALRPKCIYVCSVRVRVEQFVGEEKLTALSAGWANIGKRKSAVA